jgi:hypothetical protein
MLQSSGWNGDQARLSDTAGTLRPSCLSCGPNVGGGRPIAVIKSLASACSQAAIAFPPTPADTLEAGAGWQTPRCGQRSRNALICRTARGTRGCV